MLREFYIRMLLGFASKPRGLISKAVALLIGGVLFLALIPWLLIRFAGWILPSRLIVAPGAAAVAAAGLSLAAGLFWLVWAVWTQLTLGQGTPNPAVPPRKLIVKGPFRYCRNPIQLGAMLYYLGLATFISGFAAGLASFTIAFIAGSLYHRLVEEGELRRRFGGEYEEYRRQTPFLVPRFRRK